jgi:hypothetical protein
LNTIAPGAAAAYVPPETTSTTLVSTAPPPSNPSISNVANSSEEVGADQGTDEVGEGTVSTVVGTTAGQSSSQTLFANSLPAAFTGLA